MIEEARAAIQFTPAHPACPTCFPCAAVSAWRLGELVYTEAVRVALAYKSTHPENDMVLSHDFGATHVHRSSPHGMAEPHRSRSTRRLATDNTGFEAATRGGGPPPPLPPGPPQHGVRAQPSSTSCASKSRMAVSYLLNSNPSSGGHPAPPVPVYQSRSSYYVQPGRPPAPGVPSEVVSSSTSTHAEALRPNFSTPGRSPDDGSSSSSRSRDVPYAAPALQCEICKKTFKDRGNLRKHRKSVHNPDPRPFMCTVQGCPKGFSFKDGLTRHIQTVHEGVRPFECEVPNCGMRFKQRTHLAKHTQHKHKPQ